MVEEKQQDALSRLAELRQRMIEKYKKKKPTEEVEPISGAFEEPEKSANQEELLTPKPEQGMSVVGGPVVEGDASPQSRPAVEDGEGIEPSSQAPIPSGEQMEAAEPEVGEKEIQKQQPETEEITPAELKNAEIEAKKGVEKKTPEEGEGIRPVSAVSAEDSQRGEGKEGTVPPPWLKEIEPAIEKLKEKDREEQQSRDLEKELEEARVKYAKIKGELDELRKVEQDLKGGLKDEGKRKLKAEHERIEAEYKKLRTEYVGTSVEKFLEERTNFVDTLSQRYAESAGVGKRVYEWYKELGKYNWEWASGKKAETKLGRFFKRSVNVRTVTSTILLGVGVGFGVGSAIGWAAIMSRRALGGTASGVGSYDLLNFALEKYDRHKIEKQLKDKSAALSLSDIEKNLAILESRAVLSGKRVQDLERDDELYRDLLERWKSAIKAETDLPTYESELSRFLEESMDVAENNLNKALAAVKKTRRMSKVGGALVGTIVGSGVLAELLGKKAFGLEHKPSGGERAMAQEIGKPRQEIVGLSQKTSVEPALPEAQVPKPSSEFVGPRRNFELPEQKVPSAKLIEQESPKIEPKGQVPSSYPISAAEAASAGSQKVELLHNGKPTNTTFELRGNEAFIHLGGGRGVSRGIEGALLDLEEANPQKYDQMAGWLKEHYTVNKPGANNSEGALIHRWVLDFARGHDFRVGSGAQDLNKIMDTDIKIGANGQIEISKVNFIESSSPVSSPVQGEGVSGREFVPPETVKEFSLQEKLVEVQKPPHIAAEPTVPRGAPDIIQEPFSASPPPHPYGNQIELIEKGPKVPDLFGDALPREQYFEILRDVIKIKPAHLDRVGQMTLDQFLKQYENFTIELTGIREELSGLMKLIKDAQAQNGLSEHVMKQKKVREFVLEFAKQYLEVKKQINLKDAA